jgi:hypothetical protein
MKIVRIVFGLIYLGGALANIMLTHFNGPDSYHSFADNALLGFYRDAWAGLVIPNMTLFIVLLIAFEVTLGLLFLSSRRFLKIALAAGILFCWGTVPFGTKVLISNLPLGIIQGILLWWELRSRSGAPTS